MLLWTLISCFLSFALGKTLSSSHSRSENLVREIPASNITANIVDWDQDLALVMYAPWCKYCKQLLQSYELIASLTKTNKDLVIGKVNCEAPAENIKLCKALEVDRYPSIFFVGYGNFNQAPKSNPFGKAKIPQVARYVADLYPDAIFEWIKTLNAICSWKRRRYVFFGFFTGQNRYVKKIANMKRRLENEQRRSQLFGQELEKYKALELYDTLEDMGDPFPLLNELEPDEKNLPLRVCVADMASEYCKHFADDEYCAILSQCTENEMVPLACRPSQCPFQDKRGCTVVSTCLKTDVIRQYKEALQET